MCCCICGGVGGGGKSGDHYPLSFSAPWNPIACLLPPLLVIIHDEVTGHNSLGPVVHHVLDRLLCLLACQLMWNRRKKTKAQALGYICRLVIKKKEREEEVAF